MKTTLLWLTVAVLSCDQQNNSSKHEAGNLTDDSSASTVQEAVDNLPGQGIHYLGEMNSAKAAHTSTRLKDGRVLICGGFAGSSMLSSAEVYDPVSKTFRPVSNMSIARSGHSSMLLPGGKVLIAGGFNGDYLSSTEIFDPETMSFTAGHSMTVPRSGHTATMLTNGKILFAGGVGTGWTFLQSAELYDIQSGTFVAAGLMTTARESHTATLLQDGNVLITGGHKGRRAAIEIFSSAELYDPSTGKFTLTGSMKIGRHKHDAVMLADGNVLITGGSDHRDSRGAYNSTEIYNPILRQFSTGNKMKLTHYKHNGTSILLSNGNVVIAGGTNRAELFDPKNKDFSIVNGTFSSQRHFACATLLGNDDILITGGYDENIKTSGDAYLFTSSKN